jgi:hypothetical protein
MKALDKAALQRALDVALESEEPGRANQIREMLKENGWLYAARFSSYHLQMNQLQLRPWDRPPCRLEAPDDSPAGRLLRKMLACGMSKHDPEPMRALKAEGTGQLSPKRRVRHPQHSSANEDGDSPERDDAT